MATNLREECRELTELASRGQNPAAKARLFDALHSKWVGVRVTAARALVRWGDPQSIDAVKLALSDLAGKPSHHASVGPICDSLGPALSVDDLDWVLTLFFLQSKASNRFVMTRLFIAIPPGEAFSAIERWRAAGTAQRRDADLAVHAIRWFHSEHGRAALAHQSRKPRRGA